MTMQLLDNPIQPYDWGSTTAIAQLMGTTPTGVPQAELWMGTHLVAPSRLADGRQLEELSGPLPFLFKVLAAAQPLSIQAHPSLDRARAGFAAEEAAGVARSDPRRNYKDPNHKPELICALTPFEALCGFRPVGESAELLEQVGATAWAQRLRDAGIAVVLAELFTLDRGAAAHLADEVVVRCADAGLGWLADAAEIHPGDIGLVVAVLLNHLVLQPGEALYLGAGNLHAYLRGTGVELMANSDNVLRGGLTTKHVDVRELLSALDVSTDPVQIIRPDDAGRYRTPAAEFELSVVSNGSRTFPAGPAIVLAIDPCELRTDADRLGLDRGRSAYVGPEEGELTVTTAGLAYRASTPTA